MKDQEVLIIKMLLESLSDTIKQMGGCSMKVDYMNPLRVSKIINGTEDLRDAVKVPILIGELSVTGNPSLLVFYIGISGFKIVMNHIDILCSKNESSRGDLLYPFYFFYDQCISTSYFVSHKKICDAITEKETIIESNKDKKEYNANNDISVLMKLKTELVEFDKKFSKYKK